MPDARGVASRQSGGEATSADPVSAERTGVDDDGNIAMRRVTNSTPPWTDTPIYRSATAPTAVYSRLKTSLVAPWLDEFTETTWHVKDDEIVSLTEEQS